MLIGWLLVIGVAIAAQLSFAAARVLPMPVGSHAPVRHILPMQVPITTTAVLTGTDTTTPILYLPLVVKDYPACNDVEDNDIPAQAKEFITPTTPLGTFCRGSLQDDVEGEDDYYTITLTATQIMTITLSGVPSGTNPPAEADFPAEADYDLLLYDASLTQVVSSNQTNSKREQLIYTATNSGVYYIRVNMYRKAPTDPNTYLLKIEVATPQ
jgi:hypothetical protein